MNTMRKIKLPTDEDRVKVILQTSKEPEKNLPVIQKDIWKNICLRITDRLIRQMDILLDDRIGISRNAWILEAIQEKLFKEKIE